MANYISFCRSNYFKVKNVTAYKKFINKWNLRYIECRTKDNVVLVGFLDSEFQEGPPFLDTGTVPLDLDDFLTALASHLEVRWVAIVQHIGYEGNRYLCGESVAVNSENKRKQVGMNDIYRMTADLGYATKCEY